MVWCVEYLLDTLQLDETDQNNVKQTKITSKKTACSRFLVDVPKAYAMRLVSLKPTATAKQSIIRTQFNSGTYIRPLIHLDVCRILTRGKQPNAWLCLTNEHAADITVSLAIIAAKTAMAKNGQNKGSNKILKRHSLETMNVKLCSTIRTMVLELLQGVVIRLIY